MSWERALWTTLTGLPKPTNQTTWCWCPGCRDDLCSNDSFLSDDERGVHYICTQCGTESWWDFDRFLVPVTVGGPRGATK